LDYNESLKEVLKADRCVRLVPVKHGTTQASMLVSISKLVPTSRMPPEPIHEIGQEPVVILKGRAVGKSTEPAAAHLASVKQESDDVVQVEELDVQFERAVPVGLTKPGVEIVQEHRSVSPDLSSLLGDKTCTCGEDDDDGPSLPHKTWCPKAGE
jgi:hypothetical protein